MRVQIKTGDLLDEQVDVLISTANPQLDMSGGVNGAILVRGGQTVQEELHNFLKLSGKPYVEPGSAILTGPGPLDVQHIIHVVAVDAFYESSVQLVQCCIESALRIAMGLGASTVAMPALATGYGPLSMSDFGRALRATLQRDWSPIESLTLVLKRADDVEAVQRELRAAADGV